MEEVFYTIPQVARLLRVTENTVRLWVRHGTLEAVQIKEGGRNRYKIKQSVLDRYLHIAPLSQQSE